MKLIVKKLISLKQRWGVGEGKLKQNLLSLDREIGVVVGGGGGIEEKRGLQESGSTGVRKIFRGCARKKKSMVQGVKIRKNDGGL